MKMRKIGGKNFWIILIVSIVSLILLIVGIIFLTKESQKEFYQAGYIISSSATKTDKYYFNDNTVYKENVFDKYVFKDVDNKEVSTDKDNFIHYLDNSLAFMKNGVILDLDNLETSLVPYYNITDKSLIKYNNGSYYIETADKSLIFTNFLGRIAENKYIVVGSDIKIKLAGNDNLVGGDYFEILFIEDGIVKVENREGSYQTISDGTVIYVGEKIKIDLGTKKVISDEEERLVLSEMTIDGNENIDIEPGEGKVDKDNDGNQENGDGDKANSNDGQNNQDGDNNQDGNQPENTSVLKKEVSIDLITAKVGINELSASFQVIDTANFIKGNLILSLTNTTTGSTVYTKTLAKVSDIQDVIIGSLAPDCDYVMTISEENNSSGMEYYKKMFKTQSLDLKLVRDFVTTDSLSYVLDFGSSDVTLANVSLYDEDNKQIGTTYTVHNGEDSNVIFSELTKNTNYKAVVDSVVFGNTTYASTYTISTSDMTLKEKPTLGDISVVTDNEAQRFTLKMTDPVDEDNSITEYIYEIYKASDLTEENIVNAKPVYTFKQNSLKDVNLRLGENNLVEKEDYRFKVVAVYYDNYKYNEIETGFSDYFQVVGKPVVEFEKENIDFNQIKGIIKLKDEGCIIPMEGRECNDDINDIIIRYYGGNTTVKNTIEGKFVQNADNPNEYDMNLELNGLTENTMYTFEVYAGIDTNSVSGLQERQYIGGFTVSTKGIESLKMQNWKQNNYTFDTPISVSTEMVQTVAESNYGDKLASIRFNLYKGDAKNGIGTSPIATIKDNENIKDKYYNKEFSITSNMFGIANLDELRELSGGKLSRYYTIEVTDAFDIEEANEFNIIDNMYVFETPPILLLEDEVKDPTIVVEELTNIQMKSGNYTKKYDSNLGDLVVVGYRVIANFNKSEIESVIQKYNSVIGLNFYVYDNNHREILNSKINLIDNEEYETYFFLDYGTDYDILDEDLRRGNTYSFAYDIDIDTDGDGKVNEKFPSNKPTSDKLTSIKQSPTFRMYIDNSTASSITYKYKIIDYDNALYKDSEENKYYFYYKVNDSEEVYKSEVYKEEGYSEVTLDHLTNSSIYSISYDRADAKRESSITGVEIGKYLFDGLYNANDYNLGYKLEYGNFDNRLKIIVDDNEFLNRVSAYLLTLNAGSEKYRIVISDLSKCDEKKCIVVDYADIESFKGKNIKVQLEAFYDTGYIGFSQKSRLGSYFNNLGLVDYMNSSKVGFVYQNTNTTEKGKYVYINSNGAFEVPSNVPRGILGFDLVLANKASESSKLTTVNLLNVKENKFVHYGTIMNSNMIVTPTQNGIYEVSNSSIKNTFNPKVLDKVSIQTDDDNFIFTSITPKVSTTNKPLINGAIIDIDLSVAQSTLESDFVKTDGKYKFYVDIYKKNECSLEEDCSDDLVYIKSVETNYDNLSNVTFDGLDPATVYYYKISADMNKNGKTVKTPLFDYNRAGYVEYINSFKTLTKEDIFERVTYNYDSRITDEVYNQRNLNITSYLYTNVNFDIKYELYDIDGNLKYENTVSNENISQSGKKYLAKYNQDITGNDFVFGENYYSLIIYAVTTDLGKKLELYNASLVNGGLGAGQDIGELVNPNFNVSQNAIITNNGSINNYGITYRITVRDEDKVINNGIYNIELQNASYQNACPGNEKDCRAVVDIKNGTCKFESGSKDCNIINQDQNGNQIIEITFNDLKPDTNYIIYVSANTYRNNISLTDKEGLVYVRKSQYTKSDLGFSLGAVTPTAITKNRLVITFSGASNIENKLKKLDYNVNIIGGEKIAGGTLEIGKNIYFGKDKDNYPTLEIPINEGKVFGLNNYIVITYYYEDTDGQLKVLTFGSDTSMQYPFKNENK